MNEVNQPTGPVYTLVQREATETSNGEVLIVDPEFVLCGRAKATETAEREEDAILIFTTREFAQRCRAKIQKMDSVIATFSGSEHLEHCLLDLESRGYRLIVINRNSGVGRESITTIREFISWFK